MEEQASTSSAAVDQRRQDALKGYRDVCIYLGRNVCSLTSMPTRKCAAMRLVVRASRIVSGRHGSKLASLIIFLVRFSLKDLEKDYERTEDDIKAVQSVGQIIGEVMKQLDDERCEYCHELNRITW